jgi:hypothetical protein
MNESAVDVNGDMRYFLWVFGQCGFNAGKLAIALQRDMQRSSRRSAGWGIQRRWPVISKNLWWVSIAVDQD